MPRGPVGHLITRVPQGTTIPGIRGAGGGVGLPESWVPACTSGDFRYRRPQRPAALWSRLGRRLCWAGEEAAEAELMAAPGGGAGCWLEPPGMAGFGWGSLGKGTPVDP